MFGESEASERALIWSITLAYVREVERTPSIPETKAVNKYAKEPVALEYIQLSISPGTECHNAEILLRASSCL